MLVEMTYTTLIGTRHKALARFLPNGTVMVRVEDHRGRLGAEHVAKHNRIKPRNVKDWPIWLLQRWRLAQSYTALGD